MQHYAESVVSRCASTQIHIRRCGPVVLLRMLQLESAVVEAVRQALFIVR